MLDLWFMYKKFKTFYLVNMFKELLVFFVLFKIFVCFKKKKKVYYYIIIWYWIYFVNFIYCISFDKVNKK